LFYIYIASVASVSANVNSVPILNGTNFKDWKENIEIILGCMDLDLALRTEEPPTPTAESTPEERRNHEKWDHSNRMSIMIIRRDIPEVFRGFAKEFLAEIEKRFAKGDKAEASTLLQNLISMKYQGKGNIIEYIMSMFNIVFKLKALKLEISEDLLIHLVLIFLPT